MDAKLAKVYARDGFRRGMNAAGDGQTARAEFHRPLLERLNSKGKAVQERNPERFNEDVRGKLKVAERSLF